MGVNENRRYCCHCGARLASDNLDDACRPCLRARSGTARDRAPEVPPEFWQVDLMRDSLAGRHMGHVIRAYRIHPLHGRRPIPQISMARWLSISQAQLSRMESGGPVKDLDRLAHCARVLGIPAALLWFRLDDQPHAARLMSTDADETPMASPEPRRADHGRRVVQALEVIGAGPLGDVADSLGELVDHYSAAVSALPPAAVYEDILAVRSYANGVLDRADYTSRRADLTLAAGWLSCLLAVAACDMGEHAAARAWCSDAERQSHDARHPEIAAWAALTRALIAFYQGQPGRSVSLAAEGQRSAPSGTVIRVSLAAQEMRAAAMMGDAVRMTRARRRAAKDISLLPADAGGLGVFSIAAGEDPPYTATSMLLAGHFREASAAASRVIETVYSPQIRNGRPGGYARALLILGLSQAGLGSLDEAAAAGHTALAESRVAWPTRVLAGKLDHALMQGFPNAREASAYHDRYLEVAAAGPRHLERG